MISKLPRKISPCPINEAVVEIKFDSDTEADAIFGILYNEVRGKYPEVTKLPILQIPEQIRLNDIGLQQQPYYKLSHGNLALNIGPKVFSISCLKEYIGWEEFSKVIEEDFKIIDDLKIIKEVKRFGIRYINFFEQMDIFDNILVQITKNKTPLIAIKQSIKVTTKVDAFMNKLQITNTARIIHEKRTGSIIDIDVSLKKPLNFFENKTRIFEDAHSVEKKSFFELLKEGFLKTLNPEY